MTPQELRALQSAIAANPAAAALAVTPEMGKVADGPARDRQVAELMRAAGFGAGSKAVPCHLAKKLLIKRGRWRGIVLASQDAQHAAVESAYAAVALAEDARMEADFCDASAAGLMAPLISTGLMSADDAAALQALCRTAYTVTAEDVSRALRGPWGDEQ